MPCLFSFTSRRLLPGERDHLGGRAALARALAQRILQVDRNAVLLHGVGEGLVRQFLERRHPVARQLLELGGGIVVKGNQFEHGGLSPDQSWEPGIGSLRWIIKGDSAMARTSTVLMAALVSLAASHASFAQSGTSAPPPGTNSAGTAQSSGGAALNRQQGVT